MVEIHLSDNSKPCYVGALEGESKDTWNTVLYYLVNILLGLFDPI